MTTMVLNHTLKELVAIVGKQNLWVDPIDTAPYTLDWRKYYQGYPLAVAFPSNTDEVIRLVTYCNQHNIPIVPQGGNTSTCGGATPDKTGHMLVIALKRMNRMIAISTSADTITVQAGATLASVHQAAKKYHRIFPLTLTSEGSCQIGGNLSTNAGGMAVLRYGTMRNLTLGLEVVLPNGQLLRGPSSLHKDSSGLDLKQLFIGAEGTLGIITAATLKLFPQPNVYATALIGIPQLDNALEWLIDLKNTFGDCLTTFEIISETCLRLIARHAPSINIPFYQPWTLLVELTDHHPNNPLEENLALWLTAHSAFDSVLAQSIKERNQLWKLRESIPEAERTDGESIKHDIVLPIEKLPAFLTACRQTLAQSFPNLECIIFGHIGDGSLHYHITRTSDKNKNPMADEEHVSQIVYDLVDQHQGSIAAEHGIGQSKKKWLQRYKDPTAFDLMCRIKKLVDPKNLMNPNAIYPL